MSEFMLKIFIGLVYASIGFTLISLAEKFYFRNVPTNEKESVSLIQGEDE